MKNLAKVIARFVSTLVMSELCITAVWMAAAALGDRDFGFIPALVELAIAALPAAAVSATFVTFFIVNRLFSSRLAGYPVIILLSMAALAGPALVLRIAAGPQSMASAAVPAAYRPVVAWFNEVARAPWPAFAAGISSFAAFSAAFWGMTRLSRTRPIIGAFLAPNGALAVLYLFSVYLSGPADAAFSLAGLSLPRAWSTAILAAASALALLLADALIARKPTGGRANG